MSTQTLKRFYLRKKQALTVSPYIQHFNEANEVQQAIYAPKSHTSAVCYHPEQQKIDAVNNALEEFLDTCKQANANVNQDGWPFALFKMYQDLSLIHI